MKRRILAAVAALALTASGLFGATSAATAAEPDGAVYVALGDSIAAGTGNKPYTDQTCLRSAKAYPAVLSATLGVPFETAACAGATTTGALQQVAMLDAAGTLGADTEVVTITIGANNLGWQQVLLACSNVGDPLACQQATEDLAEALANLGPMLATVYSAVRQAAPEALILFTGYPILFGPFEGTCHIGNLEGTPVVVSEDQGDAALEAVNTLNFIIQSTVLAIAGAGDPNVGYVDVTTAFLGHALCDTGDRWISGFVRGDPMIARSLHPNTAGQQAYAAILAPIVAAALAG